MNRAAPAQAALESLAGGIRVCTRCRLHESRTMAVPGEGAAAAGVVLVGEAPGRKEDETGRPFMGAAGRYLDRLLAAHGMERALFFITSCVKCRPPGNRKPLDDELETCGRLWLRRQLAVLWPRLVVLLGNTAAAAFLKERPSVGLAHGRFFERDGQVFFVTYHPAAAMRFPAADRAIRADFKRLRAFLKEGRFSPPVPS